MRAQTSLTSDKARRGIFLELAKTWRKMAADYEKLSRVVSDLILKPARVAYPDMSSDRDDYAVLSGNELRWTWSFKRQSGKGYEMGETATREEAMAWDGRV